MSESYEQTYSVKDLREVLETHWCTADVRGLTTFADDNVRVIFTPVMGENQRDPIMVGLRAKWVKVPTRGDDDG